MTSERTITAAVQTELAKAQIHPILLAEFEFVSQTLRLWSGAGDITWNGETWSGTGDFGTVTSVEETIALEAKGLDFRLDGIPAEVVSTVFGETYRGRPARLWLGFLDSARNVLADPIGPFGYLMDTMDIQEAPESASVVLHTENRLRVLNQSSSRRSTHEDQQIDYPGDKAYEFVASLQDKELTWS